MKKFSFKDYYHSSNRDEKNTIKWTVMSEFNISYSTFYSWITRDTIPEKYVDRFELIFDVKID